MVSLKALRLDPARAEGGVWRNFKGARFKIAHTGTEAYRSYVAELLRPLMNEEGKAADEEQVGECINKAIARHLLRDWEDLEDEDGQPIPYSEAKAVELLADPELAHFREFVLAVAKNEDNYLRRVEESIAGN